MLTLACSFPPRSSELSSLRAVLRPFLESVGITPAGCDDMVLVATELAANAIEAGGGEDEVRVRARAASDGVAIEVDDDGAGFELPPEGAAPPGEQARGRGLWLVRRLTHELTVRRSGGRTVVRAVRRLDVSKAGRRSAVTGSRGALAGQ